MQADLIKLENRMEKFKLAQSNILGRYFVAAKDLSPGEVILRESVYAVGPGAFNKNYMCFACLRLLSDVNRAKQLQSCENCNVAIFCSDACKNEQIHHTKSECHVFCSNPSLTSLDKLPVIMQILLPLRVWLLQKGASVMWKRVLEMEAHVEERRNTSIWKNREVNVIEILLGFGLVPKDTDRDLLQRVCSILDVNSFELRPPGGVEDSPLRGLYPQTAIMAHDCVRNTHITVDDEFRLTVYASLPIKADETILVNYTSPFLGSEERRDHLRTGKYFECVCGRCSDRRELGSNMSTLLCPRCKHASLTNKNPLCNAVYEGRNNWQCDNCERFFPGKLIQTTLALTKSLISQVESTIEALEILLKKLLRTYHPNHFFVISLKQKLLELYKKDSACLNPKSESLRRIVEICREIIDLLDIVEPGISRSKGILLWEIHLPLVLLADRDYASNKIHARELVSRLEDAETHLKRSLKMLLLEPPKTTEGFLARQALQDYKSLRKTISQAKLLQMKPFEKHFQKRVYSDKM